MSSRTGRSEHSTNPSPTSDQAVLQEGAVLYLMGLRPAPQYALETPETALEGIPAGNLAVQHSKSTPATDPLPILSGGSGQSGEAGASGAGHSQAENLAAKRRTSAAVSRVSLTDGEKSFGITLLVAASMAHRAHYSQRQFMGVAGIAWNMRRPSSGKGKA